MIRLRTFVSGGKGVSVKTDAPPGGHDETVRLAVTSYGETVTVRLTPETAVALATELMNGADAIERGRAMRPAPDGTTGGALRARRLGWVS